MLQRPEPVAIQWVQASPQYAGAIVGLQGRPIEQPDNGLGRWMQPERRERLLDDALWELSQLRAQLRDREAGKERGRAQAAEAPSRQQQQNRRQNPGQGWQQQGGKGGKGQSTRRSEEWRCRQGDDGPEEIRTSPEFMQERGSAFRRQVRPQQGSPRMMDWLEDRPGNRRFADERPTKFQRW